MARRSSVLVPSAASLHDTFRIPANTTSLVKSLGKLSRASLIALALQWLDDEYVHICRPYLSRDAEQRWDADGEDDDDANPYDPATSIEELRGIYTDLQERRGGKREVVNRILEGDWRNGLTLRQLAMADILYIEDNPAAAHRWTALQLVPSVDKKEPWHKINDSNDISVPLPRFHGATFLKSIQNEISPLVKAHYYISRSASLPLTFVRIFIVDSPYQYPKQPPNAFTDASRIIYLVFPDSSPFIYSSLISIPAPRAATLSSARLPSLTTDTRALRRIVMDAIPKALSRPQQRYSLKATSLVTKSLHTLLALRGPWRTNTANGAFSIFADAVVEQGPLDPRLPISTPVEVSSINIQEDSANPGAQKENMSSLAGTESESNQHPSHSSAKTKRQKTILSRFGTSGSYRHLLAIPPSSSPRASSSSSSPSPPSVPQAATCPNPALEKIDISLQDPITPSSQVKGLELDDNPTMSLTFSGSDVISGLRQLAELGVIDAAKMPPWMTGEEGTSSAVVRDGKRILNDHG
ncbi:hypothetical protein DIZ76_017854 [Coccidioides immitis]|nr:hypothetical protein DIZ76_017854 [Coccidioides immitis]